MHKTLIIPQDNQLSYHSIPRNRDLKLSITNHCDMPTYTLVIDRNGQCFVCMCEAWLPITVGHITEFDGLEDIWTSPAARALQQDIADRLYSHCAVDRCGILEHPIETRHYAWQDSEQALRSDYRCYYVSINIDDSCNLACPSCRSDLHQMTTGPEYQQKLAWIQHTVALLEKFDQPVHITMTGNGDPLASAIMRPLLWDYRPGPEQTIRLCTNGLRLQKQLTDNPITRSIRQYFISTDAGSAAVYEQVRRPGRFDLLLKNLDWLQQLVHQQPQTEVLLKFVLQQANWTDQEAFVDLCRRYGFRGIINRLEDWGTWSNYSQQDVIGNKQHPEHAAALAELVRVRQLVRAPQFNIVYNSSLERLVHESC